MNILFVDFENVKNTGLNGIDKVDEQSIIYVFYTSNANNISIDLHNAINVATAKGIKIEFIEVKAGGKNALDFQLSSWLGYVIKENEINGEQYNYYIVSSDHGFDFVINFWNKKGIKRVKDLKLTPVGNEIISAVPIPKTDIEERFKSKDLEIDEQRLLQMVYEVIPSIENKYVKQNTYYNINAINGELGKLARNRGIKITKYLNKTLLTNKFATFLKMKLFPSDKNGKQEIYVKTLQPVKENQEVSSSSLISSK